MAIQFTKAEDMASTVTLAKPTDVVVADANNMQIEVQEEYSIVATQEAMKQELMKSPEVERLVSTINVNDPNTIVTFGAEAAEGISKASDQVLNSMNMTMLDESSAMLQALSNVMAQFDIKELTEEKKKGLFANLRKQLDKILAKYETMGKDVDKIYIELKKYETEIAQANTKLETMYTANIEFYKSLMSYILAGERACEEMDAYITEYRQKVTSEDAGTAAMDLQTLEQTRAIMEQRVTDLKIAESVAMQSVPMLKTMQFSNLNLIRKINSAFIITMPVFKQALAQAVMLKRQKIQAESLKALDEKTNELLIRNAQNTVTQSKMIAQMANGSSIKVDTLETTWKTIVDGITETKRIQDEARKKRVEDTARLEKLKKEYYEKMNK